MVRITKKQQAIVAAHIDAWKANNFDHTKPLNIPSLQNALRAGETVKALWDYSFGRVSITSQMMAHPDIMGHLSGAAKRDISGGFKFILNRLSVR